MNEKIAIVIAADLMDWQKMNVVAFLSGAVAIQFPQLHGKPLTTASQSKFLPFMKLPVLIYKANHAGEMKRSFSRARERKLNVGIYTRPLFSTNDEEGNLAEIAKHSDEEQDLVGIVMYGDSKQVSKALDGLKFHP